jgi:serine/threonine-protein kinase
MPEEKPETLRHSGPAPTPTPTPTPTPAPGPKPAPAERPSAPAGKGMLNINSIPVSNVILDGKPLGQTPKVNVSVSPGAHTVIFVHPEHGRKAKSVTVEAGKTAAAIVRFP